MCYTIRTMSTESPQQKRGGAAETPRTGRAAEEDTQQIPLVNGAPGPSGSPESVGTVREPPGQGPKPVYGESGSHAGGSRTAPSDSGPREAANQAGNGA